MGFGDILGQAVDALADGGKSFLASAGFGGVTANGNIYTEAFLKGAIPSEVPWEISGQDWYKVFPYQFVVTTPAAESSKDAKTASDQRFFYTLPLPPQSMVVKMVPASRATPTVGGVVEETSDNVFWVIQMTGTTGTAVSRKDITDRQAMAGKFRKKLETTGLLSGIAANLNTIVGKVGNTADQVLNAASAFNKGDYSSIAGSVIGAVNNAILPQLPYSGSAVDAVTNGFTEMQEFNRFLYTFSRLKGSNPKSYNLEFWDHKEQKRYRIILQDFTIQRSAQNPNLYRYSVQLGAWNVRPLSSSERAKDYDRFAPGGDLASVNTVGADGLYKGFKALSGIMKGESTNTIADAYLKPLGG